jgi:hypothetical protein
MIYNEVMSKVAFGEELKKAILGKKSVAYISRWCYSLYCDWKERTDKNFLALLFTLGTMEGGPEFEYSYEELLEIAEDLIACKEVIL